MLISVRHLFYTGFVPPPTEHFYTGQKVCAWENPCETTPTCETKSPYVLPHPENLLPTLVKQNPPMQYRIRRTSNLTCETKPPLCKPLPENTATQMQNSPGEPFMHVQRNHSEQNTANQKRQSTCATPAADLCTLAAYLRNPCGRSLHFGGVPAQPLRQISALCSAHLRNPCGRSLHFGGVPAR